MHDDRRSAVKAMIVQRLREQAHLLAGRRVFFFGSEARGRAAPRSDFDVGIDGDTAVPLRDLDAVEAALERLPTLYRIDLVDLQRASPEFRRQALQRVEVILP